MHVCVYVCTYMFVVMLLKRKLWRRYENRKYYNLETSNARVL